MRTTLDSALGHMAAYPRFDMEMELTGGHHRQLLQGNKTQYEKVAAAVIQDLMGPKYDVNKLSMPELFYNFFLIKASTLGTTWKFEWSCPTPVAGPAGVEARCSTSNTAVYDLKKVKPTILSKKFKFGDHKIRLADISTGKILSETAPCQLHVLSVLEDFEIIDTFLGTGVNREQLLHDHEYDLFSRRIAQALTIDHPDWVNASAEDKEALLDLNPLQLKMDLMQEYEPLDGIGYPMEVTDTCTGCGREVTLALPFLAGFLVRS